MSSNGTFDFNDFTNFDNNNLNYDNSNTAGDLFDAFNWGNNTSLDLYTHQHAGPSTRADEWYLHSSHAGGLSQPYTGVEVLGGLNGFPGLDDPTTAPTTLCPANRVSLGEGHSSLFHSGMAMPTFSPESATIPSLPIPSPVPTLSRGFRSLSPDSCAAPTTLTHESHTLPQVVPNPNNLDSDFLPAAESFTLPAAYPSPPYIPTHEELWGQIPEADPSGLHKATVYPIIGAAPPMVSLPAPVASSSGPQRTSKRAKGSGRHNPVKSTRKQDDPDEGEHDDGWDLTLVRFQAKLHDLVRDGQPPGGLSPEMALAAKIVKLAKEDLKRSPLQDTKAGEGKRPRNVEDYLTGLLGEMLPVGPTPIPDQGGSNESEISMKGAVFARLADVLEAKLVAIKQRPALRKPSEKPRTGKGARLEQTEVRVEKNRREKAKRDSERDHLERIGSMFKVVGSKHTWTRVDILIFAVVFLLHGPGAFSAGFVNVASTP